MSELSEYFLNSRADVVQLDLIEISHPSFSQTYRIVRNATAGITVTLETAAVVAFQYVPMKVTRNSAEGDLDFSIKIDLGDLGEIIPTETDAIALDDAFTTKPTVKYRTYRSDDLTAPLDGPIELVVDEFAFNWSGCSFTARAPSLNLIATGETYDSERFPMMRGFL